jgi:flagellin
MSLVIQTNVGSLQAQKNLASTQSLLATSFNRLSSGFRINSAKDDAAGLAISESLKTQVRSMTVAERNAGDAVSMSQTAEGALGEISSILARLRELATQGANGALQSSDRSFIQTEFSNLQAEMKRIMTSTRFNGQQLVQSSAREVAFQVGINNANEDRITVTFGGVDLATLCSATTTVAGSAGNARACLDTIDAGLQRVSNARARFGAIMNRLDTTVSNIQTVRLNLSSANSRIRDVDVAQESADQSRNQVLLQAGTSVLAQANQSPQQALSLLKG